MKAIIFDRDGTLIEFVNFLFKEKEVVINKDIVKTLKFLNNINSVKYFIHTNQSGVCRGMFSMEDVNTCNKKIQKILHEEYQLDFCFERIFVAPTFESIYRKPTNNVTLEIKKDFNIAEKNILYIGDTIADYQTALLSKTDCIIYRGYAAKPIKEDLIIEKRLVVYDSLQLMYKVQEFINESND